MASLIACEWTAIKDAESALEGRVPWKSASAFILAYEGWFLIFYTTFADINHVPRVLGHVLTPGENGQDTSRLLAKG